MSASRRGDASIQAFFPPTPNPSPVKSSQGPPPSSDPPVGDGFTTDEIREALKPKSAEPWHPATDYAECDIRDLQPGPRAVTFMGRIANIYDVGDTPKTPRSAKGCIKLCVKDEKGAITVGQFTTRNFSQAALMAATGTAVVRISVAEPASRYIGINLDDSHSGENGTLSSLSAPLFASLFPERDRSCHLMVHDHSDNGVMLKAPLGYRESRPLSGVMTLQSFVDGGFDVVDAKLLVVVKSIGAKKKITRKDESTVDNINLQVQDDTAEATLGLWGTCALSPSPIEVESTSNTTNPEAAATKQGWKAGETVLLLQAPGWKFGRNTYLNITSATLVDVDPPIPDADWLRRWSLRQKSREAINPPFPADVFNYHAIRNGPVRCLFTIAELDEFARAAPTETFQGYLSVVITEVKLLDCFKRHMLLSGECCSIPAYANAMTTTCKGCDKEVNLRLNPRILGQVVDETAAISSGKMLFSDKAWKDLLGRGAEDLLKLGHEEMKYLSDRLLFCRVNLMFGWTCDETKAGGRICVLGVRC